MASNMTVGGLFFGMMLYMALLTNGAPTNSGESSLSRKEDGSGR